MTALKNINNEVTAFLNEQNHPSRNEIEHLRQCILTANSNLNENIKWNGPNYCMGNEDRITMRIQPPKKQVQLIFHRGAQKLAQPTSKLIDDQSGLLIWKENDRAVATFKSMEDIENRKTDLSKVVNDWIMATN